MAGYLIATVNVRNPEVYDRYKQRAAKIIRSFGGEVIIGPGQQARLDTDEENSAGSTSRYIVVRFASVEKVYSFYRSPACQEIVEMRDNSADTKITVAEGV